MQNNLPDNWTSAFFDGELNADEAALAERRLLEDTGAREEVDAFTEIRDGIDELPRSTLPGGFAEAVLRQCEQSMLLPAGDLAGETGKPSNGLRPALTCLLTSAALLFIAVRVATTPEDSTAETSNALVMDGAQANDSAGKADEERNLLANNRPLLQRKIPAPGIGKDAMDRPELLLGKRRAEEPKASDNTNRQQAAIEKARKRITNGAAFGGGFRAAAKDAERTIHVGDVIPYLEVNGEKTAVIEVTVLDVQAAVGRLEVLLSRKLVDPSGKGKEKIIRDAKKLIVPKFGDQKKSPRQMVAVYVESNKPQLAAVMSALGRQTGAVHLSLKPPVAFNEVRIARVDPNKAGDGNNGRSPATLGEALALRSAMRNADAMKGKIAARAPARFGTAGQKRTRKKSLDKLDKKGRRFLNKKQGAGASNAPTGKAAKQTGAKPAASTPPFRLWMQLDASPVPNGVRPDAARGNSIPRKSKSTGPAKTGAQTPPFRVMIVLRERTRTLVAPKP